MFYITSEATFDGAHFLKNYDGKCRNLHGHHWRVTAQIKGEALQHTRQEAGMVVDFGDLKRVLREICNYFDHALIYERNSLKPATLAALKDEGFLLRAVPFRPTAENLARYFFDVLQARGLSVCRTEVYETPVNCAAYET